MRFVGVDEDVPGDSRPPRQEKRKNAGNQRQGAQASAFGIHGIEFGREFACQTSSALRYFSMIEAFAEEESDGSLPISAGVRLNDPPGAEEWSIFEDFISAENMANV